ncbi:hypothetical protein FOZ63_017643, partial [Perkinsus olseni]
MSWMDAEVDKDEARRLVDRRAATGAAVHYAGDVLSSLFMFYDSSDPFFEGSLGERPRGQGGLVNTVSEWMGSASAHAQKISHQVTSMRDPYRWDAWNFTAKTFVPGVADLMGSIKGTALGVSDKSSGFDISIDELIERLTLVVRAIPGRPNLRPYISSSFLASQDPDDLQAFYRSLPFASRFDGLAFAACAVLPMLEAIKYDIPVIRRWKILPITRTFVGIYGLQCVFPHEFYYCLHRVVQSASYYCYKIGPMKVGAALVVVVGAAAYAFGRGWRRRRYDDDWAAAFLRINRSQRWMASSAASDQEASGPLSSQDPLAILSSGRDFVEATRKAVT